MAWAIAGCEFKLVVDMKMKMKTIGVSLALLTAVFFVVPALQGQDLSRYRAFSLGTTLPAVLKHTEQRLADAKVIQTQPVLIQELTWWPPNLPGTSFKSDTVEQVHFSFYNAELYKISVTYDRHSTEGLTTEDVVKSISAKYGPPASVAPASDSAAHERYDTRQEPVASWEDSQYSVNLVRSSFSGDFELLLSSKRRNAEAESALAAAAVAEKEAGPQKEVDRQKKEIDALELTRQKNQKSFRP